ncbi:MAG: sugar ABC transporter permease [Chloroflexi bacterium]|nr:sugar ABC transporter permease [Chloroflexota bacterium]
MLRTRPWVPYLYIAPMVAVLLLVFGYPIVRVFDFSLRRIRGASGPFIGLENYRAILTDSTFHDAVLHNGLLLLAVPVMVLISLLISVILYDRVLGWRLYRTALFVPYILAVPIVGIVFSYVFQLNGVLNTILRAAGLEAIALDWLGSSGLALWTVMFIIVWREVGFGIILFLARLLSQNEEPLEAAKIDGCNWWQRLWYIIIPEMRGTIEFYGVVSVITMLAWVFSYIWSISKGGPGTATMVLELYIYNQGLRNSLPGVAAAVAVLLLLGTLILIAVLFQVRARAAAEEMA